jgi:hypothetical protein
MLELLAGGGTGSYLQVTYVAWEKGSRMNLSFDGSDGKGKCMRNVYRSGIIEVR